MSFRLSGLSGPATKPSIFLLPSLCFFPLLYADPTATGKSLATLREQRDKAIAEATALIDRRYRAELEALQKRATQSGDLDGALLVRNELVALKDASPADGVFGRKEQ